MKKNFKKVKEWTKRNRDTILAVSGVAIGATSALLLGRYLGKSFGEYLEAKEQNLLEVVKNNLKLKKDGELVEVITGRYSDYNTKTIVGRRWTKHNGEMLYLGKYKNVTDLNMNEKILKRVTTLGTSVVKAMETKNKKET